MVSVENRIRELLIVEAGQWPTPPIQQNNQIKTDQWPTPNTTEKPNINNMKNTQIHIKVSLRKGIIQNIQTALKTWSKWPQTSESTFLALYLNCFVKKKIEQIHFSQVFKLLRKKSKLSKILLLPNIENVSDFCAHILMALTDFISRATQNVKQNKYLWEVFLYFWQISCGR